MNEQKVADIVVWHGSMWPWHQTKQHAKTVLWKQLRVWNYEEAIGCDSVRSSLYMEPCSRTVLVTRLNTVTRTTSTIDI